MALLLPTISQDYMSYKIPDNITNPDISDKDYFYTPSNKDFIFKNSSESVSYVNIDFWSLDNAYFNNRTFTIIK